MPSRIKRIHVFLDNTSSTNKNAMFMGLAMEMVQHGILDYLRISFLMAGHTKLDVDSLFSVTAKSYNSADIFHTQELAQSEKCHCGVRGWKIHSKLEGESYCET